jgi:lysophospholipase L1-like esterase
MIAWRIIKSVTLGIAAVPLIYGMVLVGFSLWQPPVNHNPNPVEYFRDENAVVQVDPAWGFINRINHAYTRKLSYSTPRPYSVEFSVYIDRLGVRVNKAGEESTAPQILACGESTAWGYGMANERTFVSQLGQMLGLSVANISVPGASALACERQFERVIDELKPKVLLLYYWSAAQVAETHRCAIVDTPVCLPFDIVDLDDDGQPKLSLTDPKLAAKRWDDYRRWYRETSPAADSERTLLSDVRWTHHLWMHALSAKLGWDEEPRHPADQMAAARLILAKGADLAKRHGARLVVLWVPPYWGTTIPQTPHEMQELAASLGISLVSAQPALQELIDRGQNFTFPDNHLNETGHMALAEALRASDALSGIH